MSQAKDEWDVRQAGRRVYLVTRESPEHEGEAPVPWQDVAEILDPPFTETLLRALRGQS